MSREDGNGLFMAPMRLEDISCLENMPYEKNDQNDLNYLINSDIYFQCSQSDMNENVYQNVLFSYFLANEFPVVWIKDKISNVFFPYHPSEQVAELIKILQKKHLIHKHMEIFEKWHGLKELHIFIPKTYKDHALNYLTQLSDRLEKNKYLVIKKLINIIQINAFKTYIDKLIKNDLLQNGDDQVSERFYAHNEILFFSLHNQLTDMVSKITGEKLRPTFSYLSVYKQGAILERHTDRLQCEWVLSLNIGPILLMQKGIIWPFYLEVGSERAIYLNDGDAVLFKGCTTPHWRNKLQANNIATCVFCFVNDSFKDTLS